jgi:hypothetical protein
MLLDVLQPLLARAIPIGNLDAIDLCSLMCTCKAAHSAIDWPWIRILYNSSILTTSEPRRHSTVKNAQPCRKCSRRTTAIDPFGGSDSPTHLCTVCQRVRAADKACRTYKLKKDDISHLIKVLVASNSGGSIETLDPRAVLNVALIKHGGPQKLGDALPGKAKRDRERRYAALQLPEETAKRLGPLGLDEFRRNGEGGISNIVRLRDNLELYDRVIAGLPERLAREATRFEHYIETFVEGEEGCTVQELVESLRFNLGVKERWKRITKNFPELVTGIPAHVLSDIKRFSAHPTDEGLVEHLRRKQFQYTRPDFEERRRHRYVDV